jgi:hypothetical protein
MNIFRKSAAKAFGIHRSLLAIVEALIFRTQKSRWEQVAVGGRPPWDLRNEKIASFIPAKSSVLDLGCGAQTLKGYLPSECEYQPCDLIKSSPEVIVCDFNAGIYPRLKRKYTHVVCSGVLEYIRDHERFLKESASLGGTLILSYNTCLPGYSKLLRMTNHWINHFSQTGLEELFSRVGLNAEFLCTTESGEVIYRLMSRDQL